MEAGIPSSRSAVHVPIEEAPRHSHSDRGKCYVFHGPAHPEEVESSLKKGLWKHPPARNNCPSNRFHPLEMAPLGEPPDYEGCRRWRSALWVSRPPRGATIGRRLTPLPPPRVV